MIILDIDRM